jgi:hypothetical protein
MLTKLQSAVQMAVQAFVHSILLVFMASQLRLRRQRTSSRNLQIKDLVKRRRRARRKRCPRRGKPSILVLLLGNQSQALSLQL